MARYLPSTFARTENPDRAITSMAYVKVDIVPTHLETESEQNTLRDELTDEARITAQYIGEELDTEIHIRDGSLIVEIILAGNLHELLSEENLRLMQFWAEDATMKARYLVNGASKEALAAFKAYCYFRALTRLELEIKRLVEHLSYAIRSRVSTMRERRTGAGIRHEARTGAIGNLRRFGDATAAVMGLGGSGRKSTARLLKRYNAISRMVSNATDLNSTVENVDDRVFLCLVMKPQVQKIHPMSSDGLASKKDISLVEKFNQRLDEVRTIMIEICEHEQLSY